MKICKNLPIVLQRTIAENFLECRVAVYKKYKPQLYSRFVLTKRTDIYFFSLLINTLKPNRPFWPFFVHVCSPTALFILLRLI